MFTRWSESKWRRDFDRPFVQIVFGARQTGKSTLIRSMLPKGATVVDLPNPRERGLYLNEPDRLITLCRSLPAKGPSTCVFVDEAQLVPSVFDSVQHLYDRDKQRWRFILCGSSARKLRQTGANLLPGRSFLHRPFPLTLGERPSLVPPSEFDAPAPLPLPWSEGKAPAHPFPQSDLMERLAFGELPGVVILPKTERAQALEAYTQLHLEEEMRREALVKDWPAFVRFLRLAATESGQMVNYNKIAGDIGLSVPTVKSHYQLLEDMFLGFRLPAFSGSPRKNLLSTDRFLFFDLGVRHAAAGLTAGLDTARANPGPLFEQWVGIELWKRLQYRRAGSLHYLRTKDGAEVDFVVEHGGRLAPIEVKWTERPTLGNARHLLTFLREHPKKAKHAYIICRCDRPLRLHDKVTALPWFCLQGLAMSQFTKIEQDLRNHGERIARSAGHDEDGKNTQRGPGGPLRWKHALHRLRLLLTGAARRRPVDSGRHFRGDQDEIPRKRELGSRAVKNCALWSNPRRGAEKLFQPVLSIGEYAFDISPDE